MNQLTPPFRPHRAENQCPVNRRAKLLGARVSGVEADQEEAAQAIGMAATTRQATVTVVIFESGSGVLLRNWLLKRTMALPVKDESRRLESLGMAEACATDWEPGRMALTTTLTSIGLPERHVQFRVMHQQVCAAKFHNFRKRCPVTEQPGLHHCRTAEQVPDLHDRHGWIQTMPGYKNLTDLHRVVKSKGYAATPNISPDLALSIDSRSLVHLGLRARQICRETPRAFVGEEGQNDMLIEANALSSLPNLPQFTFVSAAMSNGRPGSVDDFWLGTLSNILHHLPPGWVVSPTAGFREGPTSAAHWVGWPRHPYSDSPKCSGLLTGWKRDVGALPAPGEDGAPEPDLSKARPNIHPSHGFRLGAYRQTAGRQHLPDKPVEPPEGELETGCCSPGDEPVLTAAGWVAIKDLDPARDHLAGHYRPSNTMTWRGARNPATGGFIFERSASPYRGNLVVLATERGRTRVTPNHMVLARMNDAFPEKWCVYLMRKGHWWRIGVCVTAHQPHRPGGVGGRLRTEYGDEAWILSIHDTRPRAWIAEATWQGRYGIPGSTFRSAKARSLSDRQLANIHEEISADVRERVGDLFADTGLQPDAPFFVRGVLGSHGLKKKILGAIFTTAAGNILPISGYVDIPVPHPSFIERGHRRRCTQPDLLKASITKEPFEGTVYGLDAPPHHHYVSGGAVVHDSSPGYRSPGRGAVVDLNSSGKGQHRGTR